MRWRVGVAVLLALAVGAAGGWAYAASQGSDDDPPDPVAAAIEPAPATPTLPVEVAEPDPDDPPLETNVDLVDTTLDYPQAGDPVYVVSLLVPSGWEVDTDGEAKWTYTVAGNDPNSYSLRVEVIAPQGRNVSTAVSARVSALESAANQANLTDLQYDVLQTGDGFIATYTDKDGYDRVSVEQFYQGPDGLAFATVRAVGRFRDRLGLEDLVDRITATGVSLSDP